MYKLIFTVWNRSTGKSFVKEVKMIDKIEWLKDWGLKFHLEIGWSVIYSKEWIEEHCAVIWTMTEEEVIKCRKEREEWKEKRERLKRKIQSLYLCSFIS